MQFTKQLQDGHNMLKNIVGGEMSEMTFSSSMKLFFSMLNNEQVTDSDQFIKHMTFRLNDARVGVNGLMMNGVMYQFTPGYQTIIHEGVLQSFISEFGDPLKTFEYFQYFHKMWEDNFISSIKAAVEQKLKNEHLANLHSYRAKCKGKFIGSTPLHFVPEYLEKTFPELPHSYHSIIVDRMKKFNTEVLLPLRKKERIERDLAGDEHKEEGLCLSNQHRKASIMDKVNKKAERKELKTLQQRDMSDIAMKYSSLINDASWKFSIEIRKFVQESLRMERLKEGEIDKRGIVEEVVGEPCDVIPFEFEYDVAINSAKTLSDISFEDRLVEKGIMTEEEIGLYKKFDREMENIITKIETLINDRANKIKKRVVFHNSIDFGLVGPDQYSIEKITIGTHTDPVTGVKTNRRYEDKHAIIRLGRLLERLRLGIKDKCGKEYYASKDDVNFVTIPERRFYVHKKYDVDQIVELLHNFLDIVFDKNGAAKAKTVCRKFMKFVTAHYSDRMVRYLEAHRTWGRMPLSEITHIQKVGERITQEYEMSLAERIRELTKGEFDRITNSLLEEFSNKENQSIIIIPTGILIGSPETGGIEVVGCTVIDERIRNCLNANQWKDWQRSWSRFYKEKVGREERVERFDVKVRMVVNKYINHQMKKNIEQCTEFEQRLLKIVDRYVLDIPPTIITINGRFSPSYTSDEVDTLEELLTIYDDYVTSIDCEKKLMRFEQIAESIKNTVAGKKGEFYSFMHWRDGGIHIDLSIATGLLRESGGMTDELQNLISITMGLITFQNLSDDKKDEFKGLLGDRVEVSKMDLFVAIDVRVNCGIERQKYMLQILFMIEFAKHIEGESEYSEFFNKLNQGV